jgi:hypothetical protein
MHFRAPAYYPPEVKDRGAQEAIHAFLLRSVGIEEDAEQSPAQNEVYCYINPL